MSKSTSVLANKLQMSPEMKKRKPKGLQLPTCCLFCINAERKAHNIQPLKPTQEKVTPWKEGDGCRGKHVPDRTGHGDISIPDARTAFPEGCPAYVEQRCIVKPSLKDVVEVNEETERRRRALRLTNTLLGL